ncbi:hypothetical protein QR685DRAFT_547523 [Neurospora intermedia]|uniref:Uncharacterized protein n=1 Tax=Neurospora intermedia TaxID=5142 RepID=A0ABR3D400_NEUIN
MYAVEVCSLKLIAIRPVALWPPLSMLLVESICVSSWQETTPPKKKVIPIKIAIKKAVVKKTTSKKEKATTLNLKLKLILKPPLFSPKPAIPVKIFSNEEDSNNNDEVE